MAIRRLVPVACATAALLAASVLLSAQTPPVTAGNKIFELTKVHKIHIFITPSEWEMLQTSSPNNGGSIGGSDYVLPDGRQIHVGSGFGGYFPWVHADARIDDPDFKATFRDAGLRYKGNLSFRTSTAAAPLFANFKLKLDVHGAKGTWDGEKTFNLHAGVVDQSRMKEAASFAIFRLAGVPAPRTTYAELIFTVPGLYKDVSAGVFTMIEDVNRKFLERVLPPGTGLMMKPEGLRGGISTQGDSWAQYTPKYRPDRDATPAEQQRVMDFARLISQPDKAKFVAQVESYLDVDLFLRYLAVNAFISNTDSYISSGHNFYFYLDPRDNKFRFIPWDEDLSMGRGGMIVMARPPATALANLPAAGAGTQPPPPPPPPPPPQPQTMTFVGANGVTTTRTVEMMAANVPVGNAAGGMDMNRPYGGDQQLIQRLLDDPATLARYRAIVRELSGTAFSAPELTKIVDALEKVAAGRGASPRAFLDARAAYVQTLIAGWK